MQLSIVAAGNNVNKVASDVHALIKSSTFKGVELQLTTSRIFACRV